MAWSRTLEFTPSLTEVKKVTMDYVMNMLENETHTLRSLSYEISMQCI